MYMRMYNIYSGGGGEASRCDLWSGVCVEGLHIGWGKDRMDGESWKKVKIRNGVKSYGRSGWGEVCPGGEEGTETNYDKVKRWAQLSWGFSLVDGIGLKREDRI